MRKLIINMRSTLLLVAALVINLHLIIPHDHHNDSLLQSKQGSCTSTDEHHKSNFPKHCHAFNVLASEERAGGLVKSVAFENFLEIRDIHFISLLPAGESIFSGCRTMPPSPGNHNNSLLRAPPVII